MPGKRKIQFTNGEIYHIVTRAVDGTNLFRERGDYIRMAHDIFEFNDLSPLSSALRVTHCRDKNLPIFNTITTERRERKLLVEVLAFCLMTNHVHLLARQLQDEGIKKFMQKLGGYATYYNKKYKRQGYLFQGRYRAVHIEDDRQLMTVFVYIHTNPVAIIYPGWKEAGIQDVKKAIEFLEEYKWSSYLDYLGIKNFPSITSREFLTDLMGGIKGCREFIEDWLYQKRELSDLDLVAME